MLAKGVFANILQTSASNKPCYSPIEHLLQNCPTMSVGRVAGEEETFFAKLLSPIITDTEPLSVSGSCRDHGSEQVCEWLWIPSVRGGDRRLVFDTAIQTTHVCPAEGVDALLEQERSRRPAVAVEEGMDL